jgi:hypothetical protein
MPRRSVDVIDALVVLLVVAIAWLIWVRLEVMRQHRLAESWRSSGIILADHTRLLSDELWIAEVELQAQIAIETGESWPPAYTVALNSSAAAVGGPA